MPLRFPAPTTLLIWGPEPGPRWVGSRGDRASKLTCVVRDGMLVTPQSAAEAVPTRVLAKVASCGMSFPVYVSEEEGMLQNHPGPPRLGRMCGLQCPRQSAHGGICILHALWVECPLQFPISVLDLLGQNNVSVQKHFCIFQLATVLSICIVCTQLETFSMESAVIFIKRSMLFM